MKKIFWVFFASIALLFLSFSQISAAPCPKGGDPSATGLVPCGVTCECTILNFFTMIGRVYEFIVFKIATPLATLALLIGGVILLISAGNPNLATLGRRILFVTVIGIVLVFGAWLIVNTILVALTGHGIQ